MSRPQACYWRYYSLLKPCHLMAGGVAWHHHHGGEVTRITSTSCWRLPSICHAMLVALTSSSDRLLTAPCLKRSVVGQVCR